MMKLIRPKVMQRPQQKGSIHSHFQEPGTPSNLKIKSLKFKEGKYTSGGVFLPLELLRWCSEVLNLDCQTV
jgi:hypothetical protein